LQICNAELGGPANNTDLEPPDIAHLSWRKIVVRAGSHPLRVVKQLSHVFGEALPNQLQNPLTSC
jgi:hypothetical protein